MYPALAFVVVMVVKRMLSVIFAWYLERSGWGGDGEEGGECLFALP